MTAFCGLNDWFSITNIHWPLYCSVHLFNCLVKQIANQPMHIAQQLNAFRHPR